MIVEVSPVGAALPLLRALADPTRLRVATLLAAGPRCVCVLQSEVEVAANLLSHHLRVLREAGIVEATRRGRWVDYRLRGEAAVALRALVDELTPSAEPPGRPRRAGGAGVRVA